MSDNKKSLPIPLESVTMKAEVYEEIAYDIEHIGDLKSNIDLLFKQLAEKGIKIKCKNQKFLYDGWDRITINHMPFNTMHDNGGIFTIVIE